jgi:predicted ester cyclase
MTNEDIARKTIEVVWCRGELDRIPEFYTDDFHAHQPNIRLNWAGMASRPSWVGHEGLRQIITNIKSVCPDYNEAPQLVVGSGDMVAMRMINRGTHTGRAVGRFQPSGKSFEAIDTMFVRMVGGRIAEQWGLFDQHAVCVQLGFIEPSELIIFG